MSLYISFFRTPFLLSLLVFALFEVHGANVDIKGIENERVLKNVRAHIDSLDIPTGNYQFGQFQKSLQLKVEAATQVFGYYHTTTVITPPSVDSSRLANNKNWNLQVELGPITLVRQLRIKQSKRYLVPLNLKRASLLNIQNTKVQKMNYEV